ncbi:hypothetical protein Thermo_01328 [Thermoplasmatales archaeon]|nr:hypothetical protein Thermo_01328 [Thermoplasmatales archaeon]
MSDERSPWDNASFYISLILVIFGIIALTTGLFSYELLYLMGYSGTGSLIGLGLVVAIIFWAAAYSVYIISNWQKWKAEGRENR